MPADRRSLRDVQILDNSAVKFEANKVAAFVALWESMDKTARNKISSSKKAEYHAAEEASDYAALRKLMSATLTHGKLTVELNIVECQDKLYSCKQEKVQIAHFVKLFENRFKDLLNCISID